MRVTHAYKWKFLSFGYWTQLFISSQLLLSINRSSKNSEYVVTDNRIQDSNNKYLSKEIKVFYSYISVLTGKAVEYKIIDMQRAVLIVSMASAVILLQLREQQQ